MTMNRFRSLSLSSIKNFDVLKLTDKIGNLRIPDLNGQSSSSISNSASISTNSCKDSPVYSVSKRILDRFYKQTQHSDLTRNVIDRTKSSIFDIPNSICDITSKSTDFFLTLSFSFLPGQDSFLTQNLSLPKTLDSLISFKNKLGLSKLSNVGLSLLSNDSLTNTITEKASTIYSRILIEAITYHNGYYGRFLVLVELGIRCTVWYGFHPGDALSIPVDALLFHPIDSYDSFINQPEIHVQPGFEKITLVEKEENILPKLAEAYTREKPFIDVKIPNAKGNVFMSVGLGLAIVILLSLGITPNADFNVITA